MKSKTNTVWLFSSLLVLLLYAWMYFKTYSHLERTVAGDWIYAFWAPATLIAPLFFRRYTQYKAAFVLFLFQTGLAVLAPDCFFEIRGGFLLVVMWIPALVIAWLFSFRAQVGNRFAYFVAAVVCGYTLFPAGLFLGQGLQHLYQHVWPICSFL